MHHEENMPIAVIAKTIGRCAGGVLKLCRENGIAVRSYRQMPRGSDAAMTCPISDLRDAYCSMKVDKVAERFGISVGVLYSVLHKRGVPLKAWHSSTRNQA
jgi:hypothetical protein